MKSSQLAIKGIWRDFSREAGLALIPPSRADRQVQHPLQNPSCLSSTLRALAVLSSLPPSPKPRAVVSSSSPLPPPPSSLSAKEARPDKQDVLTFHWGDEELNLNGNDSDEDYTFLGSDEHGLLSSGFFPSFDSAACNDGSLMDIGSSVSSSPSAHLPLSLPSPASTLNGSHPLSPAPSSSPVPSSPPSLLSVAPAEAFFQQHSQPPSAEAKRKTPSGRSSAVTESMATKVQSAPTTPSSLRTAKARRGGGKKPPKGGDDSKALRVKNQAFSLLCLSVRVCSASSLLPSHTAEGPPAR